MAQLLVRDLDDAVKQRLRIIAARHNRSLAAEVRHILTQASTIDDDPIGQLLDAVRGHQVEPNLPEDSTTHEAAGFE